jgi:beta-glucosidase
MSVVNSKEHQNLALNMARQSMTLLQNNNNILPLSKSGAKIAVIGPNADDERLMWGNYNGTPVSTMTILEGIRTKLPARKILSLKGCDIIEDKQINNLLPVCSIDGKAGMKVSYWNGREPQGDPILVEQHIDPIRQTATRQQTFAQGVRPRGFSAKYETTYTADAAGEVVVKLNLVGDCTVKVNGEEVGRMNSWRVVPVRIPFAVERGKKYDIEVLFSQFHDFAAATFSFEFGTESLISYDNLIAQLEGIETVVFVGGISAQLEGEEMPISLPGFKGGDRTDIELPASQRRCLQALKDAGKKVIFVNCSGSAIGLLPESQNCEAILQAWYSGELGGQAVADVLFGDYNPGGKLPITFYKSSEQLPDFEDYSMKGRTYRYMSDPLFPFGFGLSYTTFAIGDAKIAKARLHTDEGTTITVPVTNTGKRAGVEVVQVYVRNTADADGPLKSLRAFQRVDVPVGQTKEVTLTLYPEAFEWFDTESNTMRTKEGTYEVFYGNSSDAKDLKKLQVTLY